MPATLSSRSRSTHDPALKLKQALAGALKAQMKLQDESIQSLARRLGTGRTSVRRILDARNTSISLITMSRAAEALGLELALTSRRLNPTQLHRLAAELPDATPVRAAQIEDEIVAGFYGNKRRA